MYHFTCRVSLDCCRTLSMQITLCFPLQFAMQMAINKVLQDHVCTSIQESSRIFHRLTATFLSHTTARWHDTPPLNSEYKGPFPSHIWKLTTSFLTGKLSCTQGYVLSCVPASLGGLKPLSLSCLLEGMLSSGQIKNHQLPSNAPLSGYPGVEAEGASLSGCCICWFP